MGDVFSACMKPLWCHTLVSHPVSYRFHTPVSHPGFTPWFHTLVSHPGFTPFVVILDFVTFFNLHILSCVMCFPLLYCFP